MGISQSDLTKTANSVAGFPSKAAICESYIQSEVENRQSSGQSGVVFKVTLARKLS